MQVQPGKGTGLDAEFSKTRGIPRLPAFANVMVTHVRRIPDKGRHASARRQADFARAGDHAMLGKNRQQRIHVAQTAADIDLATRTGSNHQYRQGKHHRTGSALRNRLDRIAQLVPQVFVGFLRWRQCQCLLQGGVIAMLQRSIEQHCQRTAGLFPLCLFASGQHPHHLAYVVVLRVNTGEMAWVGQIHETSLSIRSGLPGSATTPCSWHFAESRLYLCTRTYLIRLK